MVINILSRIIIILLTIFICIVLGLVEIFDFKFSKRFKIIFWIITAIDIVLIIIFSKFILNT